MTLSPTSSRGATTGGVTRDVYGYNTIGGTTDALASTAYKQIFKSITVTTAGFLGSVDVYCNGNATNAAHLAPALFDDAAGAIGKVVALGHFAETFSSVLVDQMIFGATARWVSLPLGIWVTPATYWINVGAGDGCTLYYDAAGGDFTSASSQTWILTHSDGNAGATPTNSTRQYSIRANVLR